MKYKIFKLDGVHLDITDDSDNSNDYARSGYAPHSVEQKNYEWDIFEGMIKDKNWIFLHIHDCHTWYNFKRISKFKCFREDVGTVNDTIYGIKEKKYHGSLFLPLNYDKKYKKYYRAFKETGGIMQIV